LQEHQIGQDYPLFYRTFSHLLERRGDVAGAEQLLKDGIARCAHFLSAKLASIMTEAARLYRWHTPLKLHACSRFTGGHHLKGGFS
jgi:hypothetical protein